MTTDLVTEYKLPFENLQHITVRLYSVFDNGLIYYELEAANADGSKAPVYRLLKLADGNWADPGNNQSGEIGALGSFIDFMLLHSGRPTV